MARTVRKKRNKKRRSKAGKGSAWERHMCGVLSKWFSCQKADDWLWRSSMSGGRATIRRRRGKKTMGHCGDVAGTCRQGERLTKVFAIELKRGYPRGHVANMLDRPNGCAQQLFEQFIQQAVEAAENAGSYSWLLFQQRDRREAIVWMERYVEQDLKRHGAFRFRPFARVYVDTMFSFQGGDNDGARRMRIVGMGLSDFLELVPPAAVKAIGKEWK
jgi:hypothetical protein